VLLTASEGRTSDAKYSSGFSENRLESTCATRRPVRHIHPHALALNPIPFTAEGESWTPLHKLRCVRRAQFPSAYLDAVVHSTEGTAGVLLLDGLQQRRGALVPARLDKCNRRGGGVARQVQGRPLCAPKVRALQDSFLFGFRVLLQHLLVLSVVQVACTDAGPATPWGTLC